MSDRDKQLEAIRNNPTNVSFDAYRNMLLDFSFTEDSLEGGTNHYTFIRDMYKITMQKKNPVNIIYIKRAIRIIDVLEKEKKK